jgi:hypothetical protein
MRTGLLVALASFVLLPAAPVAAQETDTDVPQTFWFEIGGFRVSTQTELRLNGGTPGDEVDFERDLNLPGNTTQAYMEGFWRLGRRHQVSANWTRIRRDGGRITLDDEIEWGDDVFRVGAEVQGATDSDFLSGVYRFALYKNERFEIGPSIGLGHIWITAGLTGQAGIAGGEDEAIRDVSVEGKASSITGDIGGYFYWWPGRRFLARGDLRYIAIGLDDADAAITEGRASLTWYPWSQVGIGAQYAYTKLRYDRDLLVTELGGVLQYDGLQILVSVAF